MNIRFNVKKLLIAIGVIATITIIFLVHALLGLSAGPVTFSKPPEFVEEYALKFGPAQASPFSSRVGVDESELPSPIPAKWTRDFFNKAALVRNVMLNGESPEQLIELFTHPEKEKRVKIAFAFGAVNIMMSHDYGSGYPEKRKQFWQDVEQHLPDIQNALFEALIVSAEERSRNYLPYTIAWMPINQQLKNEMLTWAAKHHPDAWVRRFCVYYVVRFGENEQLAMELLESGVHDPVFRVRNEVLTQKIRRFKEMIIGKDE